MEKQITRTCGNCANFATHYRDDKGGLFPIFEKEQNAGRCTKHPNHVKCYNHFKCSNRQWQPRQEIGI